MNQTDKRILAELEARRRARDELRRKLDIVEGEVRLLEGLAAGAAENGAAPSEPRAGSRKARTLRRLDAMAALFKAAWPEALGAAELARRLSEATGETCTRGAVDDLLRRYSNLFSKTPDGDKWWLRERGEGGGAHASATPA